MDRQNKTLPLCRVFLLFSIFIALIYSNTLNVPWIFDDYSNISNNPSVHLTNLDADSIINSFYAVPSKDGLRRPLAYFTFAMNWYWGKGDVYGFHVVNTAIHILAGFFLFLVISLLLRTPALKGRDKDSVYFIALLSSFLWAIHPIQTQAVTYIVQRMASMAALFYIIAIFFFIKARLSSSTFSKFAFGSLCTVSFLLGVASKSNSAMLPVSLILMEFIFFRDLSQRKTQKQALMLVAGGVLLIAATGIFLLADGNMLGFFNYEKRTFTISERLMTQPRVIVFYLSQIFYPTASRFSIQHDIVYSSSLISPWTTIASILLIIFLIGLAFWRIKKIPLLSFAILFFFINHLIESTIIPLEMIFEHRNYLPSMFLFLPIAVGLRKSLDFYYMAKKPMFYFIAFSLCIVLTAAGISTYIRNHDWRSVKSLWQDAMEKAPNSSRPLHILACEYYAPRGQVEKAIELNLKALELQDNQAFYQFYSYNNIASNCFSISKDYECALQYSEKALQIRPDSKKAYLMMCEALCMLGRYAEATDRIDAALNIRPDEKEFLYLKGLILLKQLKAEAAVDFLQKCVQISPGNWQYLRDFGICLTHMGQYKRGEWFLRRAFEKKPSDSVVLIGLTDNAARARRMQEAKDWAKQLIDKRGVEKIREVLIGISKDPMGRPFSLENVLPVVSGVIAKKAEKCLQTASHITEYTFLRNHNYPAPKPLE